MTCDEISAPDTRLLQIVRDLLHRRGQVVRDRPAYPRDGDDVGIERPGEFPLRARSVNMLPRISLSMSYLEPMVSDLSAALAGCAAVIPSATANNARNRFTRNFRAA